MVGHSVDLKRSRQGLRGLMHVADAQALITGHRESLVRGTES